MCVDVKQSNKLDERKSVKEICMFGINEIEFLLQKTKLFRPNNLWGGLKVKLDVVFSLSKWTSIFTFFGVVRFSLTKDKLVLYF